MRLPGAALRGVQVIRRRKDGSDLVFVLKINFCLRILLKPM
jgi:hypothetical protein